MKPRLLHLIPTLGAGGAERQLSLLAPAMAQRGVECHVAFSQGGVNLERLRRSSVALHPLPQRRHHDPRIAVDLWRLMRNIRPQLVQTWLLQMDVMGGLAAMAAGIPVLLSERSAAALYERGWKMALRAALGRRARAIVANSQGGIDYWRSQRARGPLHLVRNCISPAADTPPEDDLGLALQPLILFAGRLSHEKNIPALVDALALALRQLPSHHALLFGEGPLRDDAQARIEASGLAARMHLAGFSQHLGFWLRRAEVFVSASHFEGHPNVVIEAAAAGCPMVLSDIPAHREVVSDRAALYGSPERPADLAKHIVCTVTGREAAIQRAAEARAATADLTLDRAVERYLKIYNEVLQA